MSDPREKIILKNLIEEIININDTDLECIGNIVVSNIENNYIVHHGINKDHNPVGHTIDAFSHNSQITVQCSIEKKYFLENQRSGYETVFPKIEDDFKKALNHNPNNVKKVYLISSQEEPPKFRKQFNTYSLFKKTETIILDAKELAKYIYSQSIRNSNLVSQYEQYLPDFASRIHLYEYFGSIPAHCKHYNSEPSFLSLIQKHYDNTKHICILSGLSGSGKTQAAIDFANHNKYIFNILWIAGEDWKNNSKLSEIQRSRIACPISVSGIFNSTRTLLIIDSLERFVSETDFHELTEGFRLGGKVLITSQQFNPHDENYIQLPEIAIKTAESILPKEGSDSELYFQFIEKCKFLPIILTTAREIIEHESINREDLFKEILNNPHNIENKDGKSIIEHIINKLDSRKKENLIKLLCDGVYLHDQRFVDSYIGPTGRIALQKIGILKKSHIQNIIYTHDIIGEIFKNTSSDYKIIQHLISCIEKEKGNMTPFILREIHILQHVLLNFYYQNKSNIFNWATYSLLQIESDDCISIIKDFEDNKLSQTTSHPQMLCIIDANEIKWHKLKDRQEKIDFLSLLAHQYEDMGDIISCPDMKLALLHHAGKCYRRIKNIPKALECFKKVLHIDPLYHVTLWQIMLIGTSRECSQEIQCFANEKTKYLFDNILEQHDKIPLRVSLAAISHVSTYKEIRDHILSDSKYVEILKDIIMNAASERIFQFYKTFYSFTSLCSYQYGDICLSLVKDVPEIFEIRPKESDGVTYLANLCEMFTNLYQINNADETIKKLCLHSAIIVANEINNRYNQLTVFIARGLAKAYIASKNFQKAYETINKAPEEKYDHWILYRKAEAELGINNPNEAHKSIAKAYKLAKKDPRAKDRISIYKRMLAKCLEAKNKKYLVIKFYKSAIKYCQKELFRQQLQNELAAIQKNL